MRAENLIKRKEATKTSPGKEKERKSKSGSQSLDCHRDTNTRKALFSPFIGHKMMCLISTR